MIKKSIDVAVGVLMRNDLVLIARRSSFQPQGGMWEFPGGKIEENETAQAALIRELREELGVEVRTSSHLTDVRYDYPEYSVLLKVFSCFQFDGEPEGMEGQVIEWVAPNRLNDYQFPDANASIVAAVQSLFA